MDRGPDYFLNAKKKTRRACPGSSRTGANENRAVPLVSIICDLLDLILISSSPLAKHGAAVCNSLKLVLMPQQTLNQQYF